MGTADSALMAMAIMGRGDGIPMEDWVTDRTFPREASADWAKACALAFAASMAAFKAWISSLEGSPNPKVGPSTWETPALVTASNTLPARFKIQALKDA